MFSSEDDSLCTISFFHSSGSVGHDQPYGNSTRVPEEVLPIPLFYKDLMQSAINGNRERIHEVHRRNTRQHEHDTGTDTAGVTPTHPHTRHTRRRRASCHISEVAVSIVTDLLVEHWRGTTGSELYGDLIPHGYRVLRFTVVATRYTSDRSVLRSLVTGLTGCHYVV